MADDVIPKIRDWMTNSGYNIELNVAQVFRTAGFSISQFEKFVDPESEEVRQIDLVAWMDEQLEGLNIRFSIYIECKYMKTPWVIFSSPYRVNKFAHFSHILHNNYAFYEWREQKSLSAKLMSRLLHTCGREIIEGYDTFRVPDIIGHSMKQAKFSSDNEKDNAYIALMQTSKCIEALDQ